MEWLFSLPSLWFGVKWSTVWGWGVPGENREKERAGGFTTFSVFTLAKGQESQSNQVALGKRWLAESNAKAAAAPTWYTLLLGMCLSPHDKRAPLWLLQTPWSLPWPVVAQPQSSVKIMLNKYMWLWRCCQQSPCPCLVPPREGDVQLLAYNSGNSHSPCLWLDWQLSSLWTEAG